MSGAPDPKSRSLARGERRYRRKVASAKGWQRIIDAKQGPCRVCAPAGWNGSGIKPVQFHHIVPRDAPWFGDDVEDNIAPACLDCHPLLTVADPAALAALQASLSDAEYAYIVGKLGESGPDRLFGVATETAGE